MKTPIETLLDQIEYKEIPQDYPKEEGLPYVTHEGILELGETKIKVCVLSDGRRIIPESEMEKIGLLK